MENRTRRMSRSRSSFCTRSSKALAAFSLAAVSAPPEVRTAFSALDSSFSSRCRVSSAISIASSSSRHFSRYASMSSTVAPYFFFRR